MMYLQQNDQILSVQLDMILHTYVSVVFVFYCCIIPQDPHKQRFRWLTQISQLTVLQIRGLGTYSTAGFSAKALTEWKERCHWLHSHLNLRGFLQIHSGEQKNSVPEVRIVFAGYFSATKQLPAFLAMWHTPSSKPAMEHFSPLKFLSYFKSLYPGKSLPLWRAPL